MPKKIDPLNKKHYGAVEHHKLTVSDIKAAVNFYQKMPSVSAKRGIMNGPGGQP